MNSPKKWLLTLGMLVLMCIACPLSALAQDTCKPVDPNNQNYPDASFTLYCGVEAIQGDANEMASAIQDIPGAIRELQAIDYNFYWFDTPADYKTYASANKLTYVAPGSTDFGVTVFNTNNVPQYTVIFQTNSSGQTNEYISSTTYYYAAQAIDALMGYVMNGGVNFLPLQNVSTYTNSSTFQYFQKELAQDWSVFNKQEACTNPTTNDPGVFSEQKDANGNY